MRISLVTFLLLVSLSLTAQTGSLRQVGSGDLSVDQDRYQVLEITPGTYASVPDLLRGLRSELGLDKGIALVGADETTRAGNLNFRRYAQTYFGIPVLNGEVTVVSNTAGQPVRLSGTTIALHEFRPAPAATPLLSAAALETRARAAAAGRYPHAEQWNVSDRGEIWASANPWQSDHAYQRTRVLEVHEPAGHRAHLFYLDAYTGKVVFEHQQHCDLNRQLYRTNLNFSGLIWREGQALPSNITAEEINLLESTAETFHLYDRTFGRRGYNGSNGLMRILSQRSGSCPNASASGNLISHCTGVVADDIVAHEWTHNYISSFNALIYRYESGAINEGLADVFGESVDLLNSRGNDTGDTTPRTGCNNTGLRWQLGEDATAISTLRDLWRPECRSDPGSRSSSQYACLNGNQDNGGVHINSGLVNRSFSLLVDGGSLNGTTVGAIGHTKALHIYYHAMANYVGRVTDFDAFGTMLVQSANDLLGVNLTALTVVDLPAMASGEIITAADVMEVQNAVLATGMNVPSPCNFQPTLAQNPPSICSGNEPVINASLLSEDWENGMTGWVTSADPVNPATFDNPLWTLNASLPDGRPGQGIFVANAFLGDCQNDLENGQVHLFSPSFQIPANDDVFTLSFDHYYSTEENYDGGIVAVSRNGGNYFYVSSNAFIYNGYDGALESNGNDNPLAGLPAFHGADQNSTTGSWGTSLIDLSRAGVQAGDNVRVRWTLGMDGCNGWLGWYLDDVRVVTCVDQSLPVVYTDLRAYAQKESIFVAWATAEEIDNYGFYVERSRAGGDNFEELGFVASGDRYLFEDPTAHPEVEYVYRLRQVDFDGTVHYSNLVRAHRELKGAVAVFPNPASEILTVVTKEDEGPITLFDMAGRQVQREVATQGKARFDVGSLAPGVYLLRGGFGLRRVVVR